MTQQIEFSCLIRDAFLVANSNYSNYSSHSVSDILWYHFHFVLYMVGFNSVHYLKYFHVVGFDSVLNSGKWLIFQLKTIKQNTFATREFLIRVYQIKILLSTHCNKVSCNPFSQRCHYFQTTSLNKNPTTTSQSIVRTEKLYWPCKEFLLETFSARKWIFYKTKRFRCSWEES